MLATAIHGRVDVIVTYNLKDFPNKLLAQYSLEAQHPDTFLSHLINLNAPKICEAVKIVRRRLQNPPKNIHEYLNILKKQELNQFTSCLSEFKNLL